jgi:hypothetical protein
MRPEGANAYEVAINPMQPFVVLEMLITSRVKVRFKMSLCAGLEFASSSSFDFSEEAS